MAPLTSIVGKKNTMEVNGAPELLCFPHSSEYLPFDIHTGLEILGE